MFCAEKKDSKDSKSARTEILQQLMSIDENELFNLTSKEIIEFGKTSDLRFHNLQTVDQKVSQLGKSVKTIMSRFNTFLQKHLIDISYKLGIHIDLFENSEYSSQSDPQDIQSSSPLVLNLSSNLFEIGENRSGSNLSSHVNYLDIYNAIIHDLQGILMEYSYIFRNTPEEYIRFNENNFILFINLLNDFVKKLLCLSKRFPGHPSTHAILCTNLMIHLLPQEQHIRSSHDIVLEQYRFTYPLLWLNLGPHMRYNSETKHTKRKDITKIHPQEHETKRHILDSSYITQGSISESNQNKPHSNLKSPYSFNSDEKSGPNKRSTFSTDPQVRPKEKMYAGADDNRPLPQKNDTVPEPIISIGSSDLQHDDLPNLIASLDAHSIECQTSKTYQSPRSDSSDTNG